jgi:gluconolactonase
MSLYPPPEILQAEVWTTLPDRFRIRDTSPDWAAANKPGRMIDSFLEGPSFDRDGNLWVTDIPYGRVFRISPAGVWDLVAQYEGWPNGLKIHRDGRIFIADYKRGILELDPVRGTVAPVVTHRHSEHFRGCNDLVFDSEGRLYFTDQGQSGLHMPNGRVYRYDLDADRLDLLLDTGPSPNGLVPNASGDALYLAMTRGNAIWRLPLMADGTVSKVGVFVHLSGGLSGPDGMALDSGSGLWVAHAGNGCVWGFSALGAPLYRVVSATGLTTTNIAFGGVDDAELFITESDTGHILRRRVPVSGRPMFSHAA